MNLRAHAKRLENQPKNAAEPERLCPKALAIYDAMWEWLEERGYEDPDQAIAATAKRTGGLEGIAAE